MGDFFWEGGTVSQQNTKPASNTFFSFKQMTISLETYF